MYRSPDGWFQYTEVWSIRTLYNMMQRGQLKFDWGKQRGFMWSQKQSSLFIHSIFWGMLDNTETFRFARHGNEYFCTDGKQRGLSILRYIEDSYNLIGVLNSYAVYLNDGETFNVNGKKFSQLPQELQDKIWDLQVNVAVLENASPDVEGEMFKRMNNGIAVSTSDIAISKNENSELFDEIGKHELFNAMFGLQNEKKKHRQVIIKSWLALTGDFNFKSAHIHQLEEDIDLNTAKDQLFKLYDKLLSIYKTLTILPESVGKKMFDNSVMYYYIPYLDMFDNDAQKTAEWINYFVKNIPEEYKSIKGFSHDNANIKKKLAIIEESIMNFLA